MKDSGREHQDEIMFGSQQKRAHPVGASSKDGGRLLKGEIHLAKKSLVAYIKLIKLGCQAE